MQPLYITGMSIATGCGIGTGAMVAALDSMRSGLAPCAFETARLATWVGQIPNERLLPVRADLAEFDCRNHRVAQLCLAQDGFEAAMHDARKRYGAGRVGVFMGTSTSGIHETELAYRRRDPVSGALPADLRFMQTHSNYALAWYVQSHFALDGPALAVSTACSSSAKVFANAARMIAAGLCDAAVVGGVDSLCLTTLYGFSSLGLLSTEPCRPFDTNRKGISIGEGAGFVLLEKAPRSAAGSSIALLGYGESSDAYHMSTPHPEGLGAKLAMQRALDSAQVPAAAVGYINLHGTGTRSNDEVEGKAVSALFGNGVDCSSTKGWTGHTLGACGAIEAIICALALERGFVPGSVHTTEVDPSIDVKYRTRTAPVSVDIAMSNAFGFGGTNCSLVLGRRQP